jgi:hypothetical protein
MEIEGVKKREKKRRKRKGGGGREWERERERVSERDRETNRGESKVLQIFWKHFIANYFLLLQTTTIVTFSLEYLAILALFVN